MIENEDTHDIYAWTPFWNGEDRPLFNCTKDRGEFEKSLSGSWPRVNLDAPWNQTVIYFFADKEET